LLLFTLPRLAVEMVLLEATKPLSVHGSGLRADSM